MRFEFNAAESHVAADIRPRLFFTPDDIDGIFKGLAFPAGNRLLTAFRRRARFLAELTLDVDDMTETLATWSKAWDRPGTKIIFGFKDIAALACLDGDSDALAACRRVLAACPEAEARSREMGRKRFGYQTGFYLGPGYDLVASRLTADERRTFGAWAMRYGVRETLDALDPRFFFSPGANIPGVGVNSAMMMWLSLLGDRYAPRDAAAGKRLALMLETGVGAIFGVDGYPVEDIGYGTAMASNLSFGVECARRLGVTDIAARLPRYRRFGEAIIHFAQPWGRHLSNTGDHGDDFRAREFILCRLARDTGNGALLWLWQTLSYNHGCIHPANSDSVLYAEVPVGPGRQVPATLESLLHAPLLRTAAAPARAGLRAAFRDRTRGIVSFRGGWGKDDTLVVFDGSQRSTGAQGHHHASAGHFSLSALGEYFSIDTGRYNNSQRCHSVMILSGQAPKPGEDEWRQVEGEGRLVDYAPHPFVDTASVDATPQHGQPVLKAERRLGLVKGRAAPDYVWIVDNINAGNTINRFDWQMQCAPESRIVPCKEGATVHGFRQGNMLDVRMLTPRFPGDPDGPDAHRIERVIVDEANPSATTYLKNLFESPAAIRKAVDQFSRPADMIHGPVYARPRLTLRLAGWNGRCLTLLIPRRKGDRPARITPLVTLPGAIAARVRFESVTDTIVVSFDHPVLRSDGVDARGGWCVVRRRNRDGKELRKAVGTNAV